MFFNRTISKNENENAVIMLKPGGPTRDGSIRFFNSSDIELWDMYVDSSGNDNFMIKDKVNNSILVNINRITHDSWFKGDVSALSFTDRTERSDLTVTELKSYISQMDFIEMFVMKRDLVKLTKHSIPMNG